MRIGRHRESVLVYCHQGSFAMRLHGEHRLQPGTLILVPGWSPHLARRQPHSQISQLSFDEDELPAPLRQVVTRVRLGGSPLLSLPERNWNDDPEALLSAFAARTDVQPPKWLHRALQLVFEHSREPKSLPEVSEQLGVSPAHLTTLVRQWTGRSLMQWSLQARLEEAALQLTETNQTVGQVAELCGFSDLSHFRRLFRRRYQTNPQEYRKYGCF